MSLKNFSVKQIASQAAVSAATVDRVINDRPGVKAYTRQRVLNAINELEEQARMVKFSGKRFYIDIIMQTPKRYSDLTKENILHILPSMQPFNISPRFHFFEQISIDELTEKMMRIIDNGSHGLIVKLPDDYRVRVVIDNAYLAGIPTITFNADVRQSKRIAFIGMDHHVAGQSAAYLMGQWLKKEKEVILISTSNLNFRNEAEREMGFRQTIRQHSPHLEMNELSDGYGLNEQTFNQVDRYLERGGKATSIYSIGGANSAILEAYKKHKIPIRLYVAHDLDETNKSLLAQHKIHAVFTHNIERDARHAFLHILKFHNQITYDKPFTQSRVNIITPYNL
ncbi:LacI family transcriptional regulator [Leucothrix sargassi]|nr:LacI family transcriptional regulator [Leucothrix sargassi]